ncbi:hypothetical protein [Streptomyces lydicus]|uniref:hypothetical protein n=1 Tax=Streptomyces lydicus TaxID=47763 RepID=UPI002870657F|nr:hypothetical protein [Streptomyces lydicus]
MVMRTPNQQLKEIVAESGLTSAAVAKAVRAVAAECGTALRTNKSTVEHWIAGVTPQGDTGRYVAVALSRRLGRLLTPADLGLAEPEEDDSIGLALEDDPIDALLPMWRCELDRRRFLTTSAYSVAAAALPLTYVQEIADRTAAARSGHTVGTAEVAAVRDMVRVFSEMDERHGGQHGRSALVQYLRDDVAPLCRGRFRTEEMRQQMLSAASRGVRLLGWKSYDAGQQGLAQRYYLQPYALAVESERHRARRIRDAHDGHARAQAAPPRTLPRPGRDGTEPRQRQGGRPDRIPLPRRPRPHPGQSRTAHGRPHRSRAGERPADRRPRRRSAVLGPGLGPPAASVYSRNAKVYETLGDHRTAAEHYDRAAGARPAGTYARIVALDLVAGAEMQLKRGQIEQACTTWNRALDHMDGVRSVRTRKAVTRMRSDLARFRARGVRCAAELDERAIDFLASS